MPFPNDQESVDDDEARTVAPGPTEPAAEALAAAAAEGQDGTPEARETAQAAAAPGGQMKYSHILHAIYSSPWAILPEALEQIIDIVRFRASGATLSIDEIQARVGGHGHEINPEAALRRGKSNAGVVAVLPLLGPISQRMNLMSQISGGTSTEIFAKQFRAVMADQSIDSVIIDVDSPGGSSFGIEELATEIFEARGDKRIVAVVNSMMASAAYWIGTAADEVVMTPGGFAGSIGVFMAHTDISKMEEMEGLKTTLVSAGRFKTEASELGPLSDEARGRFQAIVDEVYGRFVQAVARNRAVSRKRVREEFGEGRVLTAQESLERGMVDRIGTFSSVLEGFGIHIDGTRRPMASGPSRETRARRLSFLEKAGRH